MRTLTIVLLLAATAAAQSPCGDQQFLPIPTDMDPNQIATDPVTGAKLLVQVLEGYTHSPIVFRGTVCDDEGEPMIVWREDTEAQLSVDPNGVFTMEISASEPGYVYTTVSVTDGTSRRTGTYVAHFRDNHPPVLAALEEQPVLVSRITQKLLMLYHKATGNALSSGVVFKEM